MKASIIKNHVLGAFIFLTILITGAILFQSNLALSAQTDSRTTEESQYETFSFFSATTTSATSTTADLKGMDIKGAEAVTVYFSRGTGGGNAGSSNFSIEVSPDEGTTWYDFNKLITNVTNTNVQEETRVGSVTLTATSSSMVSVDLERDTFSRLRCVVVETTDGAHTCSASVKF